MTFFDEMICEVIDIALYASGVWEVIGSDLENAHVFWGGAKDSDSFFSRVGKIIS